MKFDNVLYVLFFIMLGLMSCGTSEEYSKGYGYSANDGVMENAALKLEDKETVQRRIIHSAYLTLAVKDPDTANKYIQEIAKKYNGYASLLGTQHSTIRVESDKLNAALEEISQIGKVRSKSLSGRDVTEEYMDFQIRLENAEKARERYLELLAKAENVEAALKVEKELERLNGTIDLLKGKMNKLDHLSEYSTIDIYLKEHKKPGILGYVGLGLYHVVKWLFVRN